MSVPFYRRFLWRLSVMGTNISGMSPESWSSLGFTLCTTWTGSLKSFRYSFSKSKDEDRLLLQKATVEWSIDSTRPGQQLSSSAWKVSSLVHGAQPRAVCRSEEQAPLEAQRFQTRQVGAKSQSLIESLGGRIEKEPHLTNTLRIYLLYSVRCTNHLLKCPPVTLPSIDGIGQLFSWTR